MAFFDNLKLIKRKTQYTITYKENILASIKPRVVGLIIVDYMSAKFSKELSTLYCRKHSKIGNKELISRGTVIAFSYIKRKRTYYNNKNISLIKKDIKSMTPFIKVSDLIDKYKVSVDFFLDVQIKRLSFVDNGKGTFPSVQHLISESAEDALVQEMARTGEGTCTKVSTIKNSLNKYDRETPLMENPKFIDIFDSMEDGEASLEDAIFVRDCMLARNGRVTNFVSDYIEKLKT